MTEESENYESLVSLTVNIRKIRADLIRLTARIERLEKKVFPTEKVEL